MFQNYKSKHATYEYISAFMELLSVCHTVIPERVGDELIYHAASPGKKFLIFFPRNKSIFEVGDTNGQS